MVFILRLWVVGILMCGAVSAQLGISFNGGNSLNITDPAGEPFNVSSNPCPNVMGNYLQSMTLTGAANVTAVDISFTVYCVCLEPFSATPIFSTSIPAGTSAVVSIPVGCPAGKIIAWVADNPISPPPPTVVFF